MKPPKLFLSKTIQNNSSTHMNINIGKIGESISLKQMVSGNPICSKSKNKRKMDCSSLADVSLIQIQSVARVNSSLEYINCPEVFPHFSLYRLEFM